MPSTSAVPAQDREHMPEFPPQQLQPVAARQAHNELLFTWDPRTSRERGAPVPTCENPCWNPRKGQETHVTAQTARLKK